MVDSHSSLRPKFGAKPASSSTIVLMPWSDRIFFSTRNTSAPRHSALREVGWLTGMIMNYRMSRLLFAYPRRLFLRGAAQQAFRDSAQVDSIVHARRRHDHRVRRRFVTCTACHAEYDIADRNNANKETREHRIEPDHACQGNDNAEQCESRYERVSGRAEGSSKVRLGDSE